MSYTVLQNNRYVNLICLCELHTKIFSLRQDRFSMINTKMPKQSWDFTLLIEPQFFILFCSAFFAEATAKTSQFSQSLI